MVHIILWERLRFDLLTWTSLGIVYLTFNLTRPQHVDRVIEVGQVERGGREERNSI